MWHLLTNECDKAAKTQELQLGVSAWMPLRNMILCKKKKKKCSTENINVCKCQRHVELNILLFCKKTYR